MPRTSRSALRRRAASLLLLLAVVLPGPALAQDTATGAVTGTDSGIKTGTGTDTDTGTVTDTRISTGLRPQPRPAAHPALAGSEPRPGLQRNDSGLPIAFPLQLQSRGEDRHLLLLSDPDSGREVLSAYAPGGGKLFRVLVPPGRWQVRILSGQDWIGRGADAAGEGDGSGGADTAGTAAPEGAADSPFARPSGDVTLPAPLAFGVEGAGRRSGWTIDMRETPADPEVRAFGLCATTRAQTAPATRVRPPENPAERSRLLRPDRKPGDLGRTLEDLRDPPPLLPLAGPTVVTDTLPCR